MKSKKTLYIVGAGASSEVGLPTGNELKRIIAELIDIKYDHGAYLVNGDNLITAALGIHVNKGEVPGDINSYLEAGWRIRDAMPQAISIDNFIDTHNGDKKIELCGKLAIVRAILAAESRCSLYINPSNSYNKINFSAIEKTWYSSFMKLLTENCPKQNLSKCLESITLIVFNYDRCIEHFLYNSFQNYYGIEAREASDFVNEIEIYHPYGVVGSLPWQGERGRSVKFGATPSPKELLEFASEIKTFTEGTDPDSSEILNIKKNVHNADNIVFLGFAFHKLNMELMSLNKPVGAKSGNTNYFGTAYGISNSNCEIIKSELTGTLHKYVPKVFINNKLNCANLFEEYWRHLSLN